MLESPSHSGCWHLRLPSPTCPFTASLQREGGLPCNKAEDRALTMLTNNLLLATEGRLRSPCPTAWDCHCGELNLLRTSAATQDNVSYPKEWDEQKQVQQEAEVGTPRPGMAANVVCHPLPASAPGRTKDYCECHRCFLAGEEGNSPSSWGQEIQQAQTHHASAWSSQPVPSQQLLLPGTVPSLLQHVGSCSRWPFSSPSKIPALSKS